MIVTMVGRMEECVLLAYRTPAASVRALLPRGLELLTRGEWAFWNVMACRIDGMRPAGLPSWLGVRYRHVAYRLYAQARLASGQSQRGLFFVHSDVDHRALAAVGNRVADFRMHAASIDLRVTADDVSLDVESRVAGARLRARRAKAARLAAGSPFTSVADASAFLEYAPIGLAIDATGGNVKLAEVSRDESLWREEPLDVIETRWSFLDRLSQHDLHLERATLVSPIDYRWRLGVRREIPASSV